VNRAETLPSRITAAVDYLRVVVGPTDGGEWLACEPLVTDAARLGELVRGTKAGRGTDRDDVATSLFVQGYAFRIASTAVGAWIVGDAVLDVAPARTAIALGRHRPNAVALDEVRVLPAADTLSALHDVLIDGHLAPMVACAHEVCRVGEPLLWGNVAASCASSFGAFAGGLPERRVEIRARAEAFFASARPEIAGAGRLVRLGDGWAWERRSCCLWYQTESGFKCEDCSLWTDDERRRRYATAGAAT
jgi:ferric iron reductase protein FhuF